MPINLNRFSTGSLESVNERRLARLHYGAPTPDSPRGFINLAHPSLPTCQYEDYAQRVRPIPIRSATPEQFVVDSPLEEAVTSELVSESRKIPC